MAQIFAIKDIKGFIEQPSFRKYASRVDDSVCIVLSSMEGLDNLISSGITKAISFPTVTENERRAFIHEYTGFIASLNSSFKDKFLWWATDISSKNRYVSPLPDLIEELLEIERGLQVSGGGPLLIVAPSIGIYGALRKAMDKYGRKLLWPDGQEKVFQKIITGATACFLRLVWRAVRFYTRAFWARVVLRQYSHRWVSPQKEFYVIKTFSYPSSWDSKGDYTDAFFGRLPRILSKDRNVLILSYHWQGYQEFIKHIFREEALAIFPVEFFLKGGDIFRAVFRILAFRLPLPDEVYFRGLDVVDILRFELARTINGVQVFQLLHYDAMRNMFKRLRVGTFLFTFENNPWERMCMMACRDHSPWTKVIGYQHSVVPEAALNMFVHPLEKDTVPLPFRLLTTGQIPKNILEYYGNYGLVSVESACALRYEYLSDIKPDHHEYRGDILLLLDGIEQTQQMLKFVLEQLGGNKHYRLRVRCHPALPWGLLSSKFHFDAGKYANVEISKGPLEQDLSWSDVIIYWQSSVVLVAISMGKPVINFKTNGILSYDPLFQLDHLKWTVTQTDSLLEVIESIEHMEPQAYQKQQKEAADFMHQYFHTVTPATLSIFN